MRRQRLTVADKGWSWVVMVGSFGSSMITGSLHTGVGVIHNILMERFDENVVKTSWASSLYIGMVSLTGILASVLINRFSCRVTMFIGAFLMSVGFIICAFVPSLDLVIIFFGVLTGIGSGLVYFAAYAVLGYNFSHKRNIAIGIAVSGVGIGNLVIVPFVHAAREEYGNTGFFFILAGIALQEALFGCLFFPSELETKQKIRYQNMKRENNMTVLNSIFHSLSILKCKSFLCLCVSMFFSSSGIHLVHVHLPRYAIEKGSSSMSASFLVSVYGICDCISRLLTGFATQDENIDEIVIYFGTFGLLGLSTLFFPLYASTYGGQLTYSVFFGLYSGCYTSVINTLTIHLLGIENLSAGLGLYLFFCGVGSIIGPVTAGAIIDYTRSYENSFLVAGSCITVASLLGIAVEWFRKTAKRFPTNDTKIPTVSETVTMENMAGFVDHSNTDGSKG
ncbi:monocarboxylate transporter 12-like [Ylistrum balloti]|uniref:monocarboxylate transporter 12-like n=1 Tax=Ylistrum balloti TaxID=509963 RepID=UPI002905BDB1|nr:monocarboxylate transporter 12-like [Ylistrum balloti]